MCCFSPVSSSSTHFMHKNGAQCNFCSYTFLFLFIFFLYKSHFKKGAFNRYLYICTGISWMWVSPSYISINNPRPCFCCTHLDFTLQFLWQMKLPSGAMLPQCGFIPEEKDCCFIMISIPLQTTLMQHNLLPITVKIIHHPPVY